MKHNLCLKWCKSKDGKDKVGINMGSKKESVIEIAIPPSAGMSYVVDVAMMELYQKANSCGLEVVTVVDKGQSYKNLLSDVKKATDSIGKNRLE
jgi:hypothetical protein